MGIARRTMPDMVSPLLPAVLAAAMTFVSAPPTPTDVALAAGVVAPALCSGSRRTPVCEGASLRERLLAPPADLADVSPTAPIVVLGKAMGPDGLPTDELVARVRAGAALADSRPEAPLVVTGTPGETAFMRGALTGRRVLVEDASHTTLSNARNTRAMIPDSREIIIVTSDYHARRALADFRLAFDPDTRIAVYPVAIPGAAPEPEANAYRDAALWLAGFIV